eukprot:1615322-Pyramimonas_sp.AAC.1
MFKGDYAAGVCGMGWMSCFALLPEKGTRKLDMLPRAWDPSRLSSSVAMVISSQSSAGTPA